MRKDGNMKAKQQAFNDADLESFHDEWDDNISLLLRKFVADSQEHQHVVTVDNTHCI